MAEKSWCRRRDSNPHGLLHTPLKRACLPVPPLRHSKNITILASKLAIEQFIEQTRSETEQVEAQKSASAGKQKKSDLSQDQKANEEKSAYDECQDQADNCEYGEKTFRIFERRF